MSDLTPRPSSGGGGLRVVCVDDDTLIREGVLRLLEGVEVVAVYPRVEPLLEARPAANVVLLDLWMPSDGEPMLQGLRAVASVAAAGYRVLIHTNERRREVLARCLAAGATGITHKTEPLSTLVEAAHRVAAGDVVVTTALAGLAELVHQRGALPRLSPRQLEVLRGRARGESYKAIGSRLYISPKTAEEYMAEVGRRFADVLRTGSPADLERHLGVGPGDLLDPG